jgi:hypothetical protein
MKTGIFLSHMLNNILGALAKGGGPGACARCVLALEVTKIEIFARHGWRV